MPGRARDGRIFREKVGMLLQEARRDTWPRSVIVAGNVAAIGKTQPATYQGSLVTSGKITCFDLEPEISPRRETILARDAGLRVMQAEPKRRYLSGSALRSHRQAFGEARNGDRVSLAIETQQLLRLLFQMVEIGPEGQRLHHKPPCIRLPKVRNTGSTKVDDLSA
jgi:hypothetical protein